MGQSWQSHWAATRSNRGEYTINYLSRILFAFSISSLVKVFISIISSCVHCCKITGALCWNGACIFCIFLLSYCFDVPWYSCHKNRGLENRTLIDTCTYRRADPRTHLCTDMKTYAHTYNYARKNVHMWMRTCTHPHAFTFA